MPQATIEKRIRISGILIVVGLLIELITLYSPRPTAFLTFMFFGGACLAAGILFFLYALITKDRMQSDSNR